MRATSFDAISDLYDRHRPPYPDCLFSVIIALSGIGPGSRLLEIGAGTGHATMPMARRDFRLTCLEPGHNLATILRAKVADVPHTTVVESKFEDWADDVPAHDLIYSAQAFHWLDPEMRFPKAASLLKRHGWLAILGHSPMVPDSEMRAALEDVYSRSAPALAGRSSMAWYACNGPIAGLVTESGLFGRPVVCGHRWSRIYRTDEYLGFLRTRSEYQSMPANQREYLDDEVARVIDSKGRGVIVVNFDSNLFMATRLDGFPDTGARKN